MDLFLSGLPQQLTDRAMERILEPLLKAQGVRDYKCTRMTRTRNGIITFLEAQEAQAFLNVHGDYFVGCRRVRRLQLANMVASCVKSRNPPDNYLLRALQTQKQERERTQTKTKSPAARPHDRVVKLPLWKLSCGVYAYNARGQLEFHPQVSWQSSPDTSLIKFINRTAVIKFDLSSGEQRRVEIPFSSVWELIVSSPPSAYNHHQSVSEHELVFTLVEAPRLYAKRAEPEDLTLEVLMRDMFPHALAASAAPAPPLSRLPALDESHRSVVGTCLVYVAHVRCGTIAAFDSAVRHLMAQKALAIALYTLPRQQSQIYNFLVELDGFEALLAAELRSGGMSFEFAFQWQALVQNAFLLPGTAIILTGQALQLKRGEIRVALPRGGETGADGFEITPQAVRRLQYEIPFPGPGVEAVQLSPGSLWRRLVALQVDINEENALEQHRLVLDGKGEVQSPAGGASFPASQSAWRHPSAVATTPDTTQVVVHRALVTPTRVILQGPEMEAPNRVLRLFPGQTVSTFLRVQFADEGGGLIQLGGRNRSDNKEVFKRFRNVLDGGLVVPAGCRGAGTKEGVGVGFGGERFGFLGWSMSSLRAHSVWLSTHPYNALIDSLGDFSQLRCPARCAARIGQAFSETATTVPLTATLRDGSGGDVKVQRVKDVTSDDGERVFSDGVGTMSPALAKRISAALPYSRKRKGARKEFGDDDGDVITCVQVRFAGAKGMLCMDSRLGDGRANHPIGEEVLRIRPSMVKFNGADERVLEICDAAFRPLPLFLNRQMIRILEDMGAPEDWFFGLQERAVDELRAICNDPRRLARFLQHKDVAVSAGLPGFLRRLSALGLDYAADETGFLLGVVEAVLLRELRQLKHKARIPVPSGATLFGVLDETGWLKEGEVYVTFDTHSSRAKKTHTTGSNGPPPNGTLLVITRSPALHPGDIRSVRQAIPPPAESALGQMLNSETGKVVATGAAKPHPLLALRNCVVFSRHGKRDLPSQLGGGDLDGDTYNVIWDEELCAESRLTVHEPADYKRVPPVDLGRAVTKEDMTKFFVQFMETDILGMAAIRHMVLADRRADGTRDPDCIRLAELHSNAVDFPKTGVPVNMTAMNIKGFKPWIRPDFLSPSVPTRILNRNEVAIEQQQPAVDDGDDDDELLDRNSYYESTNLLGKLYRAIDEQKIWEADINRQRGKNGKGKAKTVEDSGKAKQEDGLWMRLMPIVEATCQEYFPDLDVEGKMEDACRIRHCYEDGVLELRRQFMTHPIEPLCEVEVFTGHIFNRHSGTQSPKQRELSTKLREHFDVLARWIVQDQIRNKDAINRARKKAAADAKTEAAHNVEGYSDDDSSDPDDGGSRLDTDADTDTEPVTTPSAVGDKSRPGAPSKFSARCEKQDPDAISIASLASGTLPEASSPLLPPERIEALRTSVACLRVALGPASTSLSASGEKDDDDGRSGDGRRGRVESFRVLAAAAALRDLDAARAEAENRAARGRRWGEGGGRMGGMGRGVVG